MPTPAKIIDAKLPAVALIGRVNVGKSTLFNKMTGEDKALVSIVPGTTRTRNIGIVNWRGKNFKLIDTGGLTFDNKAPLEDKIIEQTEIALAEAHLIIFLVDSQSELLPQEKQLAKKLIRHKEKIILVANKVDSQRQETAIHDRQWLALGLGEPYPISAISGANVGDLLDSVLQKLNKLSIRPKKNKPAEKPIKVCLIGKPNVGKSTLFNALIGKEEVIVSEMPHTTREPFDTLTEYDGQPILFVDTAGIRRKSKVSGELEIGGIQKSIESVKKSDIVLLLLDASEPISNQDQQLGGLLEDNLRSVIIIINKWDTADANDDQFRNQVKKLVYQSFPHLDFAPIIFVSAKTQYRVHQIFPLIMQAWQSRNIQIDDNALDKFLQNVVKRHRPTRGKGTLHPRIIKLKQLRSNPPFFMLTIKAKTSLHTSYVRYLENRLREKFGFLATPIAIKLSKRKKI